MLPFIEFTKETVLPEVTVIIVEILIIPLPLSVPLIYDPELKYVVDIPSLLICKANKLEDPGAS
ncbi:hypothetical protein D3C71_1713200 [compost metagenome]